MFQHRPTPTSQHYTTRLFTLAIIPLAIYLLQMAEKVYSIAGFAVGILVFIKVFIDVLTTLPAQAHHTHTSSQTHTHRTYQSPPCNLCGQANQILVPHTIENRYLWICQDCDHCLSFSQQCDEYE